MLLVRKTDGLVMSHGWNYPPFERCHCHHVDEGTCYKAQINAGIKIASVYLRKSFFLALYLKLSMNEINLMYTIGIKNVPIRFMGIKIVSPCEVSGFILLKAGIQNCDKRNNTIFFLG
jgi:hypothetical protein